MRFAIVRSLALLLAVAVPAAAGAQAVDKTEIWNANKRAVVKLKVTGRGPEGAQSFVRAGSGIIVGSNGTIVTALGVVGKDEEWFEVAGRREREVEVIGLDQRGVEESLGQASVTPVPTLDIAVLNITGSGFPAASVGKDRPGEVASIVAILWEYDSSQPEPVSADLVPTDRRRHGDLLTVLMADVPGPGPAGAGLFDAAGELVGVITNRIGATKLLAVPSDRFAQFLTGR